MVTPLEIFYRKLSKNSFRAIIRNFAGGSSRLGAGMGVLKHFTYSSVFSPLGIVNISVDLAC
jgi:hypothetical protein